MILKVIFPSASGLKKEGGALNTENTVCSSVRLSAGPSVGPSQINFFEKAKI